MKESYPYARSMTLEIASTPDHWIVVLVNEQGLIYWADEYDWRCRVGHWRAKA